MDISRLRIGDSVLVDFSGLNIWEQTIVIGFGAWGEDLCVFVKRNDGCGWKPIIVVASNRAHKQPLEIPAVNIPNKYKHCHAWMMVACNDFEVKGVKTIPTFPYF